MTALTYHQLAPLPVSGCTSCSLSDVCLWGGGWSGQDTFDLSLTGPSTCQWLYVLRSVYMTCLRGGGRCQRWVATSTASPGILALHVWGLLRFTWLCLEPFVFCLTTGMGDNRAVKKHGCMNSKLYKLDYPFTCVPFNIRLVNIYRSRG